MYKSHFSLYKILNNLKIFNNFNTNFKKMYIVNNLHKLILIVNIIINF